MKAIFRVDVKRIDRRLEEHFRRINFDLYRKGVRRSAAAWIGLAWYSMVLLISLSLPGGKGGFTLQSFVMGALLVFIWFMAAFRRLRNRFLLRLLFLIERFQDRRRLQEFAGNCFLFGEEGFRTTDSGDTLWKYAAVDKIAQSREAIFLYLKEGSGLYFSKNNFTVGTSEAFLTFIAAKTGRDVIQVKG